MMVVSGFGSHVHGCSNCHHPGIQAFVRAYTHPSPPNPHSPGLGNFPSTLLGPTATIPAQKRLLGCAEVRFQLPTLGLWALWVVS